MIMQLTVINEVLNQIKSSKASLHLVLFVDLGMLELSYQF